MNDFKSRGRNSVSTVHASILKGSQLLKKRFCSHREQNLSPKSRPQFGRALIFWVANRKSPNFVVLVKYDRKIGGRVKSGNFVPVGFSAPLSVLWAL